MSSVIGSLRVNLGLDSAQFHRGAKGVDAPLKRMKAQFAAISGGASAMGVAISAAALAGAKQIDEAAKSARRLDSSVGGFRALELAAGEAGVSLSGLTNDIQTMNREIAKIGTSGNAGRALETLAIDAKALEGLDADQKLAMIADQVKALGLDAGQATAVLQDLGVRNREMSLLVLQGGDAIRGARTDIEDYGLAISKVDSDKIEKANDALARIGLVTQYAGQQLAVALVPAMGAMAKAMTDSLREGGLLRAVIDGLVGNLDLLANTVGAAVVGFGVRYVGALALSTAATFTFSGALAVLKKALITSGIGALVVGAGVAITYFTRLSEKAGGFGTALGLLSDLASEVWDRIKLGVASLNMSIDAAAQSLKAALSGAFAAVVDSMAWAVNKIIGGYVGAFKAVVAAWGGVAGRI